MSKSDMFSYLLVFWPQDFDFRYRLAECISNKGNCKRRYKKEHRCYVSPQRHNIIDRCFLIKT